MQIIRDIRLTFFDQLGIIGGTLGLCMGFSLISFVEILYWMFRATERLCITGRDY